MAAKLTPGMRDVALKVQEAMVHSDVRARLSDAVNDVHRANNDYGGYIDHTGDGESGDCIYSCNGDIRSAPYEIGSQGGKAVANIDMDDSTNVVPRTVYEEEADDDDHYASMTEAFVKAKLYTELPLYERFISKGERDAASADDFAGKGKSYPILKPSDVSAAVHAMGRAGSDNVSTSTLKSRIIAIAKRKGWTQYLPKAWRGDTATESARNTRTSGTLDADGTGDGARQASESGRGGAGQASRNSTTVPRAVLGALDLRESFDWSKDFALQLIESTGTPMRMKVKLIQAGKGSSAFYPAEVLKRDGPNVFTKGTHIYINHATSAEEAMRPEGDWHKLAGALDENAHWDESSQSLISHALFTSDYAPLIKEKAAFTGMSIRAAGVAESGKKQDGLPILKELTHAESVDVVTRAGAGGMILTESAKPNQEGEMTLQEAQKLIDEGVAKQMTPLIERAIRADAKDEAFAVLEGSRFTEAAKRKIVENSLRDIPRKDGALDVEALRKIVVAEAGSVAEMISEATGGARVFGMGPSAPVEDPEKIRAREKSERKEAKRLRESEEDVFGRLMGNEKAAEFAANKKVA